MEKITEENELTLNEDGLGETFQILKDKLKKRGVKFSVKKILLI